MLTASVHTLGGALAAYAPLISILASALTRLVCDLAVERQRQRPGMSYIVALYIVLYETACGGAARRGVRRSMSRTYGINITAAAAAADATQRLLATHLLYSQSLLPRRALSQWRISPFEILLGQLPLYRL